MGLVSEDSAMRDVMRPFFYSCALAAGLAFTTAAWGQDPTGSEESSEPPVTQAPDCNDSQQALTALQGDDSPEAFARIQACFDRFYQAVENLRQGEDIDPTAVFAEASERVEFQRRVYNNFARMLQPGGEFDDRVYELSVEIDSLEASISALGDEHSDRRQRLQERLEQRRQLYVDYTTHLQELRGRVSDGVEEITEEFPVLVLEIRMNNLDEALDAMSTALNGAAAMIDAMEETRNTFNEDPDLAID